MSKPRGRAKSSSQDGPGPGLLVGRFFGVPVYFSPSWLLIAGLITITYAEPVRREVDGISATGSYLAAFIFAVLLAASLLLHELAHTAVSLALGLKVRRVVIFLLGGVSEIIGEPKRPREEYLVAVAGPLVSLLLAGLGGLFYPLTTQGSAIRFLLILITLSNLVVMVFNMLPGLPLDGGRVLRAAAWHVTHNRLLATRVSAIAGKCIAILVVIASFAIAQQDEQAALTSALVGMLLAAFIWFGASQSVVAATLAIRLPILRVADLVRPILEVPAQLPVAEALRRAQETGVNAVVVVDSNGQPTALVSEERVRKVPEQRRPWTQVFEVSRPLEPGLMLSDALEGKDVLDAMRHTPASEYLVVGRDGTSRGVLTASDVEQLLRAGRLPDAVGPTRNHD